MPTDPPTVTILLIEDQPGDQLLTRRMLAESGDPPFTVETRASLEAGLRWLCAHRQDIARQDTAAVLLDMNLPDSAGMDTLRRVLEAAPTLPVVVVTGLDDPATGRAAVKAGAQDYLVKGHFDGEALRRSLAYAIARFEAEMTIARLHRRNQRILDALGEGVIGFDGQGLATFLNPALVQLAERDGDELLGQPAMAHLHTTAAAAEALTATLADGQQRQLADLTLSRGDGTEVPVELLITAIPADCQPCARESGAAQGAVAAYRDVTVRHNTFALIRHQLSFQQQILDLLPIALVYADGFDVVIGCNRAWESLRGQSRSAMLGLPLDEVLPAPLWAWLCALREAGGAGETATRRITLPDRRGILRHGRLHGAPLKGEDGTLTGHALAFLEDTPPA